MNGWIKLFYSTLDWGWFKDIPTCHLWIYILLKAYWQDGKYQDIEIKKGSFPTTIKEMSAETGLTVKQVRLGIEKLVKTGEIAKKRANNKTIISVLKWSKYQGQVEMEGNSRANEGQTKGKPTVNKDYKNIRHIYRADKNVNVSPEDEIELLSLLGKVN